MITALWHKNENVAETLNGTKIELGKQKHKKIGTKIERNTCFSIRYGNGSWWSRNHDYELHEKYK